MNVTEQNTDNALLGFLSVLAPPFKGPSREDLGKNKSERASLEGRCRSGRKDGAIFFRNQPSQTHQPLLWKGFSEEACSNWETLVMRSTVCSLQRSFRCTI